MAEKVSVEVTEFIDSVTVTDVGQRGPAGPQGDPGPQGPAGTGVEIDPLDFRLVDPTYSPSYPAYFRQGSSDVLTVPTAASGQQGKETHLKFHIDGSDQYIKGESIYLETEGTPDYAYLFGHDVTVSNYNTTGVGEAYGYSANMNFEWPVEYGYGGYFSVGAGSANASGGLPFLAGVSSYVLTGHHCDTGRGVNFEAALVSAPSSTDVIADELIGLNVWGTRNDKCTADKTYGVFLESFTKNGSGAWNHIYGIHANADTFDNTPDGWFLHSLSDAPSLLSGELQLAELSADPANPASGRCTLFAIDNGSGKTQLMVKFPSGATQQIAIEG